MKCVSPISIKVKGRYFRDKFGHFVDFIEVPCGKCVACRVNYSSIWSTRLMHELNYWNSSVFLTLTYDDDHLPEGETLVKRDLQLFFKRLRKNSGRALKYYACGEYGDVGFRPHYHCIIFGFDFASIKDRRLIKSVWNKSNVLTGYNFGSVTRDSCRYTCDYIMKAFISGKDKSDFWLRFHKEPPFRVCSQGIGKRYCLDYASILKERLYCLGSDGKKVPLPRYYRQLLGISGFDYFSIIQKNIDLYNELYDNLSIEEFSSLEYIPKIKSDEFLAKRELRSNPRDLSKKLK